ncbi:MAG TPA: tetratricopeptide repeat protein [Sphingomicrobium sp.]|nr:tetratricopeptide repeat protein [Sphingomicrobium sp.]
MTRPLTLMLFGAAMFASPATAADPAEIGYPKGSLGFNALVEADYSTAESQLRANKRVAKNDPARLINLGVVLAKTGRAEQAARLFERAMAADEVELILASGEQVSSRDAARRAMRALNAMHLDR